MKKLLWSNHRLRGIVYGFFASKGLEYNEVDHGFKIHCIMLIDFFLRGS